MTIELTHDQACIVRMYLNCWMDDTSDYYHHLPAELFVPDEDEDEDVEPDPDLCREALTAYDAKWMIVERPPADEGLIKATGQTYVPKVPPRPTIDDEAILRKAAAQLAVKIASWTDKESLASDRQLIEALTWASWKNAYKMARSIEHIICDIDAGFIDQLNEYADDILCGICRAATAK